MNRGKILHHPAEEEQHLLTVCPTATQLKIPAGVDMTKIFLQHFRDKFFYVILITGFLFSPIT